MRQAIDGADGAGLVLDDEAGHAVLDHFRHRATVESDDGRAAGHGLDHHQPNGSGQSIGTKQDDCAAEEDRLFTSVISPIIRCRANSSTAEFVLEIVAVGDVDLGGDCERNAAMLRDPDGAVDALLRRMRPRNAR